MCSLRTGALLVIACFALATGCSPAPAPGHRAPVASAPAAPPCTPSPPPVAPPSPPADRASLAAGLDSFLAEKVLSDRGELTSRSAPFLVRGRIWDLEYFGHAHPFYA